MKHQTTTEQAVINFIKKFSLLSGAKKIIIGLSGGADSVFALHFFHKYKHKYKIDIAALHVNHQLRGRESERDEIFCSRLCNDLNIDFQSVKIDVKNFAEKNKKSLEEAARDLRYDELIKYKDNISADCIVTAHNSNDNTETVLLNVVKGTGINGLSGIPIIRDSIIRPFLCISKEEILDYLKRNNIDFIFDRSNEDNKFKRNFLRNEIVPKLQLNLNPSIHKTILNSSLVLKSQKNVIDYFIEELVREFITFDENGISFQLKSSKNYPEYIISEVFARLLPQYFAIEPTYTVINKIVELINKQVGTRISVSENIECIREREHLLIHKIDFNKLKLVVKIDTIIDVGTKKLMISKVNSLPPNFDSNRDTEFIDGDKISGEIIVRNWRFGDKIKPLGLNGTKKVSDVLTDLKVKSSERNKKLVLVNNGKIIWIIGYKLSDEFKISRNTKNILKLCLK